MKKLYEVTKKIDFLPLKTFGNFKWKTQMNLDKKMTMYHTFAVISKVTISELCLYNQHFFSMPTRVKRK